MAKKGKFSINVPADLKFQKTLNELRCGGAAVGLASRHHNACKPRWAARHGQCDCTRPDSLSHSPTISSLQILETSTLAV